MPSVPLAALASEVARLLVAVAPAGYHAADEAALLAWLALHASDLAAEPPGARTEGQTAVIPLVGVLTPEGGWGSTSLRRFERAVNQAAADSNVSRIVLAVDSPGGTVTGTPEAAAAVAAARAAKPVVAVVEGLAASAAYWIASQASEIVATPSSDLGSIGVYTMHVDLSRALENAGVRIEAIASSPEKVERSFLGPLSDAARQFIQDRVNEAEAEFVGAVAKGRGRTAAKVRAEFGKGRVIGARAAVAAGMADRLGSLVTVMTSPARRSARRAAAAGAFA